MNWKRIFLLALFDLRHSMLRLKGLVFLIPFLLFWYWALNFLWENGEKLLTRKESLLFFSWWFDPSIAQTLLILHPPTISMFFILALGTAPVFVMLAGNDQVAGDAGRQTFRFFLTRCTRAEIFGARFISHYSLIAVATLLTAIVAVLISLQHDQQTPAEIIAYTAQVVLLVLLYMLPYSAYMAAISAMMSSALSALLLGATLYVILLLAGAWLTVKFTTDISLVPSGVKNYLFRIQPADLQYGLTGLLAYTLIYLGLGWLIFRNRNI